MPELKFAKYIITEAKAPPMIPSYRHESAAISSPGMTRLAYLGSDIIQDAPHMGCMWLLPRPRNPDEKAGVEAHIHDYDEILGFYGADPYNPNELFADIEFWLEDEKYTLTKSCTIFVPKGMKHCPLLIHRLDKPVFHFGWTPITPEN
jgi:hypothetical protein